MKKLSMDDLDRLSVDDFKKTKKLPITLVLDNVRSLHNVGSVFRTADGFAIEHLVLCGITGTPPHRDIEKTALGATQSMSWEYEPDVEVAVSRLKREGMKILAVEQAEGSLMLDEFCPAHSERYVLVFGNEVNGVSQGVMDMVDSCIEIPQFGTKHSFNIVISAGIVLWDFYSKLIKKAEPDQ